MHSSLFLLYSLTFVPIHGPNAGMCSTMREAAFIQTGIKSDWDLVKVGATKAVPVPAKQAAAVGAMIYTKEIKFKSKALGDWAVRKDRVSVTWGFSW